MHICGRAHQIREGQTKLVSVIKQLGSSYASIAAAPSGLDSVLYGHSDCAQSDSDNPLRTHQQESISVDKFHLGDFRRESFHTSSEASLNEVSYSNGASLSSMASKGTLRSDDNSSAVFGRSNAAEDMSVPTPS